MPIVVILVTERTNSLNGIHKNTRTRFNIGPATYNRKEFTDEQKLRKQKYDQEHNNDPTYPAYPEEQLSAILLGRRHMLSFLSVARRVGKQVRSHLAEKINYIPAKEGGNEEDNDSVDLLLEKEHQRNYIESQVEKTEVSLQQCYPMQDGSVNSSDITSEEEWAAAVSDAGVWGDVVLFFRYSAMKKIKKSKRRRGEVSAVVNSKKQRKETSMPKEALIAFAKRIPIHVTMFVSSRTVRMDPKGNINIGGRHTASNTLYIISGYMCASSETMNCCYLFEVLKPGEISHLGREQASELFEMLDSIDDDDYINECLDIMDDKKIMVAKTMNELSVHLKPYDDDASWSHGTNTNLYYDPNVKNSQLRHVITSMEDLRAKMEVMLLSELKKASFQEKKRDVWDHIQKEEQEQEHDDSTNGGTNDDDVAMEDRPLQVQHDCNIWSDRERFGGGGFGASMSSEKSIDELILLIGRVQKLSAEYTNKNPAALLKEGAQTPYANWPATAEFDPNEMIPGHTHVNKHSTTITLRTALREEGVAFGIVKDAIERLINHMPPDMERHQYSASTNTINAWALSYGNDPRVPKFTVKEATGTVKLKSPFLFLDIVLQSYSLFFSFDT